MSTPRIHVQNLTVHIHAAQPMLPLSPEMASATEPPTAGARFELAHAGAIVTDHKTGLQWLAAESPTELNFAAAEEFCATLRLGGFSDWRLPDVEELESIRDLSRHKPCIDTAFFKSNAGWVWTRTPCAWSSGSAWVVDFDFGDVSSSRRVSTAFVRAVRVVSPAGQ